MSATAQPKPRTPPRHGPAMREWESKERLAEHVSEILFSVSPRTIERWPLEWIIVHKRSLARTDEALNSTPRIL